MIGLDKVLGVVIIIASFYFGFKMYLMSRDPRKDSVIPNNPQPKGEPFSSRSKDKLRKTTKN